MDLPTIVECHKTLDNKTLYKTGDISQMLICSHEPPDTASVSNLEELPTTQQKEYLKKFTYSHGREYGTQTGGWSGSQSGLEFRLTAAEIILSTVHAMPFKVYTVSCVVLFYCTTVCVCVCVYSVCSGRKREVM